jgi:hypothetical protein
MVQRPRSLLFFELADISLQRLLGFVVFPFGIDQTPKSFFAQIGPPG